MLVNIMDIKKLFDDRIITVASLPKDNSLDTSRLADYHHLLIPIDHDYPGGSAAMHNAVFEKFLPEYKTTFVVADPKDAKLIFDTFRNDPLYFGGGVGSGFKDRAIDLVDDLDDSAKVTGSVNVIRKENHRLIGYNTDGVGFLKGLTTEYPDSVKGKDILILGAGGTALPIAYELSRAGPNSITILNRTVSKAKNIADKISDYVVANYGGEDEIPKYISHADLVINTSNKGAHPFKEYSAFGPITDDLKNDLEVASHNASLLPKDSIVADILLEDLSSTLKLAQEMGYRTHNGKSMNLYQAVPALKIMVPLDSVLDSDLETIMRDAL